MYALSRRVETPSSPTSVRHANRGRAARAAIVALALAAALALGACSSGPSPEDRAREAWQSIPADGRADVCEAYAVFGPVIVNEVIDTVVGTRDSLSDDDAAALKGVVLEECFR